MMHQLVDMLPTVAGVTLAFLAGGIVKGVISLGLPLIAVPLLMFVVDGDQLHRDAVAACHVEPAP